VATVVMHSVQIESCVPLPLCRCGNARGDILPLFPKRDWPNVRKITADILGLLFHIAHIAFLSNSLQVPWPNLPIQGPPASEQQGLLVSRRRRVLKVVIPVCVTRRFEFHAEWLRDEPCDATTTGQNTVPVSTLSWLAERPQGT
jgi:hypothetical protein